MPAPAIVDAETWDLAQAQLARNRAQAGRNNTRQTYLLRGLLRRGHRGRRLVGIRRPNGACYECSARYPRGQPWSCDQATVRADTLEGPVWDYVRGLLADPALLQQRYEEGRGDPAVDQPQRQEQARLARQLQSLDRETRRRLDAYQAGAIELAELQERRQRIGEHGRLLRARRTELDTLRRDREQELRLLEGADAFCHSVQTALADSSFPTKQQVLRLVVDHIVVEPDRITIYHVIPTGPVHLQTDHANNTNPAETG